MGLFNFGFILALIVSYVCISSASLNFRAGATQKWVFDNHRNRDNRFQDFYDTVNDMEEVELDKRFASAIKLDPALACQFLLSGYILLNHAIESIVPEDLRRRIRLQNLIAEIILHVLEMFLRMQIPEQLANGGGIFLDRDMVGDARMDMMRLAESREGQQVAFSLICIFNGFPKGCVLPLLLRDIPAYTKGFGIALLLGLPSYGDNKFLINFFDGLCRVKEVGTDPNATESEGNLREGHGRVNKESTLSSAESGNKAELDISVKNSRVLVDLMSESVSLLVEVFFLIRFVTALASNRKDKLNLLIIFKQIFCAVLTLQYVSVRGRTYGALVTNNLKHSIALESLKKSFQWVPLSFKSLSIESVVNMLKSCPAVDIESEDDLTKKRKKKVKRKLKKEILLSEVE
jgi:hypothetical protein